MSSRTQGCGPVSPKDFTLQNQNPLSKEPSILPDHSRGGILPVSALGKQDRNNHTILKQQSRRGLKGNIPAYPNLLCGGKEKGLPKKLVSEKR